jgi:hypothetical protein
MNIIAYYMNLSDLESKMRMLLLSSSTHHVVERHRRTHENNLESKYEKLYSNNMKRDTSSMRR